MKFLQKTSLVFHTTESVFFLQFEKLRLPKRYENWMYYLPQSFRRVSNISRTWPFCCQEIAHSSHLVNSVCVKALNSRASTWVPCCEDRIQPAVVRFLLENRKVWSAQNSGLSVMHKEPKYSVILIIISRLYYASEVHIYN